MGCKITVFMGIWVLVDLILSRLGWLRGIPDFWEISMSQPWQFLKAIVKKQEEELHGMGHGRGSEQSESFWCNSIPRNILHPWFLRFPYRPMQPHCIPSGGRSCQSTTRDGRGAIGWRISPVMFSDFPNDTWFLLQGIFQPKFDHQRVQIWVLRLNMDLLIYIYLCNNNNDDIVI